MLYIDIGIFAHNEEHNIKHIIEMVNQQDILYLDNVSVRVYILTNGCTDGTVNIAKAMINEKTYAHFQVIDLTIGGKSRTWNRFVHDYSRSNADQLIFCDSDIWFTKNNIFKNLSECLQNNSNLVAVTSRPIKDLSIKTEALSIREKVITASGDGLNNWKKSICGQLYILTSSVARSIYLPLGLPVEDGYLRAMIATNNMTTPENLSRISGNDDAFHFYYSERSIIALINHQTRLVLGSSINYLIFNELRDKRFMPTEMISYTKSLSENESWLPALIKSKLPSKKYGWVPWHFLLKRLNYATSNHRKLLKPKTLIMLILGFGFDLIVYINAQYKMARGNGVGFW